MHYPPAPSTLTCALRAPTGRLLGDGRFDVWWAIASNGAVAREIAFDVRSVDPDHDTELRQAITELARSRAEQPSGISEDEREPMII